MKVVYVLLIMMGSFQSLADTTGTTPNCMQACVLESESKIEFEVDQLRALARNISDSENDATRVQFLNQQSLLTTELNGVLADRLKCVLGCLGK